MGERPPHSSRTTPPSDAKELTRKLFWAVTSSLDLPPDARRTTFIWAADLAETILNRFLTSPPTASRPENSHEIHTDRAGKNSHNGQAVGGEAGRNGSGSTRSLPTTLRPSRPPPRPVPSLESQKRFASAQAHLRRRAREYVAGATAERRAAVRGRF